MHAIAARAIALAASLLLASAAMAQTSLRFTGNPISNVDRVMIRIDPHVPADVGGDFTLEFWMKANAAQNNPSTGCNSGSGENWITGNIMFDRAIFNHDRHGDYGVAIFSNGNSATLAFGILKLIPNRQSTGLCGSTNVADGQWHHVAITRATGSGAIRIYVDGQLDVQGTGPTGDVSYENGVPSQVDPGITLNVDNFLGIGAEKFDADPVRYPSFSGWIDEVRISTVIRYPNPFTRPTQPFAPDANTAALYHFDEGSGTAIVDSAPGGASPGVRHVGNPERPTYSTDTPFAPTAGALRFTATNYSSSESEPSATINVERVNGTVGAVSVNYATANATAIAPADYSASSGILNWGAGVGGIQTFAVGLVNDVTFEANETVALALSAPTGGATLGSVSNATLTIVDDDNATSPGNLQFSAPTFDVSEGSASAQITVARTVGSNGAVSVVCATTNGSATAPADYATASQVLTWATGDTAAKSLSVPIVDDVLVEGLETVNLSLSSATGGAVIGTPGAATLRIADNDAAQPGALQMGQATYSVNENAGSVTVQVTRTGGSAGAVAVQIATSPGTAAAGADYTTSSTVLTWAAGDSAVKTATVTILDDSTDEADETLNVMLSAASGGATLGTPVSASVTIVDNDTGGGGSSNNDSGGGAAGLVTLLALFAARFQRRFRWQPVPRLAICTSP